MFEADLAWALKRAYPTAEVHFASIPPSAVLPAISYNTISDRILDKNFSGRGAIHRIIVQLDFVADTDVAVITMENTVFLYMEALRSPFEVANVRELRRTNQEIDGAYVIMREYEIHWKEA
jgi:hypothetical protein